MLVIYVHRKICNAQSLKWGLEHFFVGLNSPLITPIKKYFKVILGLGNRHPELFQDDGYVGLDTLPEINLEGLFPTKWRDFNRIFISKYLENYVNGNRIGAELACGMLWSLGEYLSNGGIVISLFGTKKVAAYIVSMIEGDYEYVSGAELPHRKWISWLPNRI